MSATATPVRFDEATHTYRDGDLLVPSVTQCLESAGLVDYAGVNPSVLEQKAKLGDAVHQCLHYLYTPGSLDWDSVHEDWYPYVRAGEKFLRDTKFSIVDSEKLSIVTVNGMKYGMRPDLVGKVMDSEWVIDFKCGAKEEKHWRYQAAGYGLGGKVTNRGMVQLKPDGTYKLFAYDDPNENNIFLCTLALTWEKINQGITWRKE